VYGNFYKGFIYVFALLMRT